MVVMWAWSLIVMDSQTKLSHVVWVRGGPARHSSEIEKRDEKEGQKNCLRYYPCASSAKNAIPVAQAPCQHRMTEGTVHRITV